MFTGSLEAVIYVHHLLRKPLKCFFEKLEKIVLGLFGSFMQLSRKKK